MDHSNEIWEFIRAGDSPGTMFVGVGGGWGGGGGVSWACDLEVWLGRAIELSKEIVDDVVFIVFTLPLADGAMHSISNAF